MTLAPLSNSSSACTLVGVFTGISCPWRGPAVEMVRVGVAELATAATRFTGPIRLIRSAT